MITRFISVIIVVVVGMFVYDNYIADSDSKKLVKNIINNEAIADIEKSTQQEFQEFKEQRLKEFEEFKKGNL